MTTLLTLRERVRNYLLDLPAETQTLVDAWINKALREAQESHPFRAMHATHSIVTTPGDRSLGALPSGWLRVRDRPWIEFGDGGSKELDWASSSNEMVRQFPEDDPFQDGPPRYILQTAEGLEVWPTPDDRSLWPDGNYRIRVPYLALLGSLTQDGSSNWFTENMGWYLVFYATAEGLLFNREEERAPLYFQKAQAELQRGISVDKRSRMTRNATVVPVRDVYGNTRSGRL